MHKAFPVLAVSAVFAVLLASRTLVAQQIVITEVEEDPPTQAQPKTTPPRPPGQAGIPAGLFDQDPMVRLLAVEKVEKGKMLLAVNKLASMIVSDPFTEVRQAACRALATLGATSQIGALKGVAANDSSAVVRAAAAEAVRKLESRPQYGTMTRSELLTPSPGRQVVPPGEGDELDNYRKPELATGEGDLITRKFALGLGTMGGYGLAAIDARFRIHTGAEGLPYVGIELGGGWSPPAVYPVISGPIGDISNEDNKWKIISGGAAVLLYLHRLHYIAARGGIDIGQGPYAILGYGFEQLNVEGFFSWGVEVGILYHPVIVDWVDNLVDCNDPDSNCTSDELWPVIPYVRFSLHFYLI